MGGHQAAEASCALSGGPARTAAFAPPRSALSAVSRSSAVSTPAPNRRSSVAVTRLVSSSESQRTRAPLTSAGARRVRGGSRRAGRTRALAALTTRSRLVVSLRLAEARVFLRASARNATRRTAPRASRPSWIPPSPGLPWVSAGAGKAAGLGAGTVSCFEEGVLAGRCGFGDVGARWCSLRSSFGAVACAAGVAGTWVIVRLGVGAAGWGAAGVGAASGLGTGTGARSVIVIAGCGPGAALATSADVAAARLRATASTTPRVRRGRLSSMWAEEIERPPATLVGEARARTRNGGERPHTIRGHTLAPRHAIPTRRAWRAVRRRR